METKKLKPTAILEAAQIIKRGGLVAFPTETVFGLGADATNDAAVKKIYQAKGRPSDNPLIVHVAKKGDVTRYAQAIPEIAKQLMDHFWPGPLTLILNSNGTVAPTVTGGLTTVGLRMPSHPLALHFIEACDVGLAAPSANLSGRPSPTTTDHVYADLNGRIDGIFIADHLPVGVESTVLDLTSEVPTILRPGDTTQAQIERVIGPIQGFEEQPAVKSPKAPGMKYKHYAPNIPVWMTRDFSHALQKFQDKKVGLLAKDTVIQKYQSQENVVATFSLGPDEHVQSANAALYDGLRTLEKAGADVIIAQVFPAVGAGIAYMNRLNKASAGKIVE